MQHCGTKRLETERLILRRYVMEDAAAVYKNWASDDEVTKYLTWPTHKSHWTIALKDNGEDPVGDIAVVNMNESISMMHIGYCIGKAWWHRGITSEALKAVMDFLFDVVGANRIEARHDPRNPNSGGVMKKCGMKYEGTLRSAGRNGQGICDECYYALLKEER